MSIKPSLNKKKILIANTENSINGLLKKRFKILGYTLFLAKNGKDILDIFFNKYPDLVIIDTRFLDIDSYEVCQMVRAKSKVPLIIFTNLTNFPGGIKHFELDSSTYISKPFLLANLEAKIESLIWKPHIKTIEWFRNTKDVVNTNNLTVNKNTKVVIKNKKQIKLTNNEYRLFNLLMENTGKPLSRIMIFENIWGYKPERSVDTRVIDVLISRLRSKTEDNPSQPDLILTIRGKGYMFQKP